MNSLGSEKVVKTEDSAVITPEGQAPEFVLRIKTEKVGENSAVEKLM